MAGTTNSAAPARLESSISSIVHRSELLRASYRQSPSICVPRSLGQPVVQKGGMRPVQSERGAPQALDQREDPTKGETGGKFNPVQHVVQLGCARSSGTVKYRRLCTNARFRDLGYKV